LINVAAFLNCTFFIRKPILAYFLAKKTDNPDRIPCVALSFGTRYPVFCGNIMQENLRIRGDN